MKEGPVSPLGSPLNSAKHRGGGFSPIEKSPELSAQKFELNQEEIEEFEKANIEDIGIPVNGPLSPSSHKFSTQDMDGIILDPITFHSNENLQEGLAISSDKYEDNILYIASPSDGQKMMDDYSDSASISSTASSLFNTNFLANNFLDNPEEEIENPVNVSHSFIAASNHGINTYDKSKSPGKSIKEEDLTDLITQYNSLSKKSMINFDYNKQYETFEIEINDWFISNELSHLEVYKDCFLKSLNKKDFSKYPESEQDKYIKKLINKLKEYYDSQDKFHYESTIELKNALLLSNTNNIIFNKLIYIQKELAILQQITYLIFGNYGFTSTKEEQIKLMKNYFVKFIKNDFLNILILNLKKFSTIFYLIDLNNVQEDESKSFISTLKVINEVWYLNLTCFYFILTTYLFEFMDYKETLGRNFKVNFKNLNDDEPNEQMQKFLKNSSLTVKQFKEKFLNTLENSRIFIHFLKYIEKWKSENKPLMKIRNVLILINKLTLVEFGSIKNFLKTKKYLKEKFHIKTKEDLIEKKDKIENVKEEGNNNNEKTKLYAFPLDYYVYAKDVASRYPNFDPPNPSYPKYLDNNSSLSQFIEVPRTLDAQYLNNNLPVPTIHIATPAPSPTSSPSMVPTGNGKGKRSFQTNQAFPFIYPISSDDKVPFSIKEASEIFASQVVESFAKKQLWNERVIFMQQERGWKSNINPTNLSLDDDLEYKEDYEDEFEIEYDEEINNYPDYKIQIKTLVKIEKYYEEIFPMFESLIEVFIKTIKSNNPTFENNILKTKRQEKIDNDLLSLPKIPKVLKNKFEIIKSKEVTLKNISSIISQFMKWFKLSHILKAENLGTIIFDSGYPAILLEYLQNEEFQTKLFNDEITVYEYDFFQKCNGLRNNPQPDCYFYNNLLGSDLTLTQEFEKLQLYEMNFNNNMNKDEETKIYDEKFKGKIFNTSGEIFNLRYILILNNLFKILQKVLLNKIRRLISFSEKLPIEIFRIIFKPFYNYAIYKSLLKILKEIIPYNGKKWKSINMDLISLIYINLNLKLKDHWLSGRDIDNEIGDSEGQELALRALIQFYTARKYQLGTHKLGYERRNSDFFGRETDLIANHEINERNE